MMEDDTNVLVWTVLLANFPTDSLLSQDMKKWGEMGKEDFIRLEIEVSLLPCIFQILSKLCFVCFFVCFVLFCFCFLLVLIY
jgi:hypothetical protein